MTKVSPSPLRVPQAGGEVGVPYAFRILNLEARASYSTNWMGGVALLAVVRKITTPHSPSQLFQQGKPWSPKVICFGASRIFSLFFGNDDGVFRSKRPTNGIVLTKSSDNSIAFTCDHNHVLFRYRIHTSPHSSEVQVLFR